MLVIVDQRSFEDNYPGAEIFTNVIDTIVSPNYPDNYENYEFRQYLIIAPTRREIVLIFNTFDVEHQENCYYDSLTASNFPTFSDFGNFWCHNA